MKGRFVTLFAAALVSMTSAGACGAAQGRERVQEKVQEGQQRVDEEVKKAQK